MSWVTGANGGVVGVDWAKAEPAKAADTAKIEISLFIFFFLSGVISAEKLRDVDNTWGEFYHAGRSRLLSLANQAIDFSSILPQAYKWYLRAQPKRAPI